MAHPLDQATPKTTSEIVAPELPSEVRQPEVMSSQALEVKDLAVPMTTSISANDSVVPSLIKAETRSTMSCTGNSSRSHSLPEYVLDKVPVAIQSENPARNNLKSSKQTRRRQMLILLLSIGVLLIGIGAGLGIRYRQSNTRQSLPGSQLSHDTYSTTMSPSASNQEYPTYTVPPANTASPTEIRFSLMDSQAATTVATVAPSLFVPTTSPTDRETSAPSIYPTKLLTESPTAASITDSPTSKPSDSIPVITYVPGNLVKLENKLLLSEGLSARIIATSGKRVEYHNGTLSEVSFHSLPDGGASFPDTRDWNAGGWVYVSNSEMKEQGQGGVGAITFDNNGNIVDYRMILEGTTMNCAGGKTPWNTWVSCEEVEFDGQAYQVDPFGDRPSERTTVGSAGGRWEAFAYDDRNKDQPRFFLSEDHNKGTTRRFTPSTTHWGGDEWKMLHEDGVIDYLLVHQNSDKTGGTFEWVSDIEAARNNARTYFPQSEGIDVHGSKLYLVCKGIKQLFVFDLDDMTYQNMTTTSGLFDGSADQLQRVLDDERALLYFTEEGGVDAGVHARDELGRFFTILESPELLSETTGLSFSPNGMHMYVAYQENGILYDVKREDGLPFNAQSLNVKYHSVGTRRLSSQWVGF